MRSRTSAASTERRRRRQIRRVGTPPFFAALAAPCARCGPVPSAAVQADASVVRHPRPMPAGASQSSAATRSRSAKAHIASINPSTRYLVHLHAPGWNVIGATRPWLPGVAVGHNERVAWGMTPIDGDTQDIYVERRLRLGSCAARSSKSRSRSRAGRSRSCSMSISTRTASSWPQIATGSTCSRCDGAAPSRARLPSSRRSRSIARATGRRFVRRSARWKMPARRVVYADADGNIGFQDAALVPIRRGEEWRGWRTLDDLPHAFNPPAGFVAERPKRAQRSLRRDGGRCSFIRSRSPPRHAGGSTSVRCRDPHATTAGARRARSRATGIVRARSTRPVSPRTPTARISATSPRSGPREGGCRSRSATPRYERHAQTTLILVPSADGERPATSLQPASHRDRHLT